MATGPMDRNTGGNNLVSKILSNIFCTSTATTITQGTGGIAWVITLPFKLRLLTAVGSDTANGTELSGTGYTAGGSSLGTTAFAYSAGVITNNNVVSWSVGSTWSTITSIEIWDSAATALRYLQGNLTSSITGAVNGDTVQFAASSISYDGSGF